MHSTRITALAAALGLMAQIAQAAPQGADLTKPPSKDWPMVEGNWGNQRHSSLDKINTGNVATLGGAWMHAFQGGSRGTPVVVDGKMFVHAGAQVVALNPKTGEVLWTHDAAVAPSFQFKGVTVAEGLVFYGTADAHIVALDENTGKQVWSSLVGDDLPVRNSGPVAALTLTGQYISGAPTYAEGKIITGMSNGDFGIRGRVVALDAKTGKKAWEFYTVPAPGAFGHDTWPSDNEEWKRGGGGVWNTPVVDPALGMVYFGVGNPVSQWGGELRKGDNLFTDSVVALDLKTGAYKWHYQVVHHDVWEADIGTPLVFYDAKVDGKMVKALGAMRTDGYLFLLDRATGKPVFPVEERPVPQDPRLFTHPTQPFPVGADEIGPNCVEKGQVPEGFNRLCHFDPVNFDTLNAMYPILSMRSSPMSYDPATGYFIATGTPVWPMWLKRFEDPNFFLSAPPVPGIKTSGIIAAIDSRTDKIVWQKNTPNEMHNGSGATTTAGGLMFHGDPDGNLQAYDTKTGALLWQFQTGAPETGPAAIYEVEGEEYVAVLATGNLWAFKLGGKVGPLPAPPAPQTETSFGGRVIEGDQVAIGGILSDNGLAEKVRQSFDEYFFAPTRIRVKAGGKVTWTNKGKIVHEVAAQDGSWTTGKVQPGQTATVTFDKPGSYVYVDREHPWMIGQIVVR